MAIHGRGQMTLTDMNDVVAQATAPLNPIAGTLWFDTANVELKVYVNGKWEKSNKYDEYVQSRGQNLITNGTGLLGNNYNFSTFTFEGADNYSSSGSFTTNTNSATRFIDELMPVNPDLAYRMTYYTKANPYVGARAYGMIVCYDADKLSISPQHTMFQANTLTTLAQDLKAGDTIVYLASATNWSNNVTTLTHKRGFIFWNYKNSYGYAFPELTYSRNAFLNMYDDGAVDYINNRITLRTAWTGATIPAGTKLSNSDSGGGYKYISGANYITPQEWGKYTGIIGGVDTSGKNVTNSFHPATASVKIGWLLNRDVTGGKTWLSNISFNIDVASQGQVDEIQATLGNMANDNVIEYNERKIIKDKLSDIMGYVIPDTSIALSTGATLDIGTVGKGSYYFVRRNATMAGLSTSDARYIALTTAWENATTGLKPYLEAMSPVKPWNLSTADSSKVISVTKATFRDRWLKYYQAELDLANATADQLKKNVDNVAVGGTNYASNGDFTYDFTKSLWASSYVGQTKSVVDVSTERPPFKYALYVKNTTNANAGIFMPDLFAGASAEALVDKEITISFWAKYSGVVQGANSFNRGRFGELIIEGQNATGTKYYRYPRASNVNADSSDVTSSETYYFSGSDTTWKKYTVTHKLTLPTSAVKLTKIQFKHGLEGCVGEFWTTGLKIEIGNKATDYSDSPYDIQSRITSVEFKTTPDGIFSTVSESSSFNATLQPEMGDYSFENGVSMWKQDHALTTSVTGASVVAGQGQFGKNVIQITGEKTLVYGRKISISTARVYRIKFRVRQTVDPSVAGASKVFAGVASYDASKTPIQTATFGSHRYCAIDNKIITVADGWVEFEGTISGEGNDSYGQFIAGTKYISPLCIINNSAGSGTVQIDFLTLEDITDIDHLATKVESVEQKITAEGITTTIKSSDFYNEYTNAVGSKADASFLSENYMDKDAVDSAINNIDLTGKVDELIADENSNIRKTFATQYQLEETSTNLTAKFSATGGMNILKNSVGYADFIPKAVADSGEIQNWFTTGVASRVKSTQESSLETLGFGSGFQWSPSAVGSNTSIEQYINVVPNRTYTFSWYINKTNNTAVDTDDGAFKLSINEFESATIVPLVYSEVDAITEKVVDVTVDEYKYGSRYITNGYEAFNVRFTPTTNKVHLKAFAFGEASVLLTGLMVSIGDMALQWSLATGEAYNTNVRMDISGIRVSQLEIVDVATGKKEERGYTRISPDEFAGYYDVTGDGIPDKVFWLNGDELVARRVRAEAEITMGSIKIVKVPADDSAGATYVGWAFIPND